MNTIQLPRNVQFLYEEHLARLEFSALGCHDLRREGDHWDQLTGVVNGTTDLMLARSAYLGTLDGKPSVYSELIRPQYQGGQFNRTRSVNQYLTHWIYPYRGKFHPQMVRGLLNILGVQPGWLVAEPYLGSGTAALEASLLGANVVGVDLSPLCVLLTRVKTQAVTAVERIRQRVDSIVKSERVDLEDRSIATDDDPTVSDFLQVARMVTLSDVARRRREGSTYLRKNLVAMLSSVEDHWKAIERYGLTPGRVSAKVGDCRDLRASGISDNSIDAIVTSPPYSIALDYVKNDEHALDGLGVDTNELRGAMTGVRGRGPAQKLHLYNADMQAMFHEVARILKPRARAAFVIGDATVDGREYTTTDQMSDWAVSAGLILEQSIPKIVYGLYGMFQDEKILIFRKPSEEPSA
jgi:tRNA G10  N-methylase Trm11